MNTNDLARKIPNPNFQKGDRVVNTSRLPIPHTITDTRFNQEKGWWEVQVDNEALW